VDNDLFWYGWIFDIPDCFFRGAELFRISKNKKNHQGYTQKGVNNSSKRKIF